MTFSADEYGWFFFKVYNVVARIPRGKVASYGQIAGLIGMPRNARMIGRALRVCPDSLPWQRVVMKDGSVAGGEYAPLRRAMLEAEGVTFLPDGRIDMDKHQWRPQQHQITGGFG